MANEEPELFRGYTASQLRLLLQTGDVADIFRKESIAWLGEWERREAARISAAAQAERERMDASSAEQMRLSLESNATARQVKTIAIATLIVATIGSIAAIAALFVH